MMETSDKVGFSALDREIPLVARPLVAGIQLSTWLKANMALIDRRLQEHGAILFRGFEPMGLEEFEAVVKAISPEPLQYLYRSTPRSLVGDRIYTATEYPPNHSIPLHNELAYQRSWPLRLILFCVQPAETGGETPIASTLRVTDRIDSDVKRKFEETGVMYVRNYEAGPDLSWQTVFQTSDQKEVEQYCRTHDIEYQWKNRETLRTRQVCQAIALHPTRREDVWFNQAHLFHISSLGESTCRALLKIYREEDLPRNAYYGDGSKIEDAVLEHIRNAYSSEAVCFTWTANDVLLLDNMLVSHARNPYKGKRQVLAAMTDRYAGG